MSLAVAGGIEARGGVEQAEGRGFSGGIVAALGGVWQEDEGASDQEAEDQQPKGRSITQGGPSQGVGLTRPRNSNGLHLTRIGRVRIQGKGFEKLPKRIKHRWHGGRGPIR